MIPQFVQVAFVFCFQRLERGERLPQARIRLEHSATANIVFNPSVRSSVTISTVNKIVAGVLLYNRWYDNGTSTVANN